MIVGYGDIAGAIEDTPDKIFFASGVSNSQETREPEYDRERELLLQQPEHSHLVYFSSLAVLDGISRYLDHKREMEGLIRDTFDVYTIVRIGNLDWGENPHTLINYLKAHPEAEIQDVYRYIVDKDEFQYWLRLIPDWSCEISIPGKRMKVAEVYRKYVGATD